MTVSRVRAGLRRAVTVGLFRRSRPAAVGVTLAAVVVTAVLVMPGSPAPGWLGSWWESLSTSGLWSLVTMTASVTGLWLAGHNPRWGWWAGLPTQAVWIVGGIATDRPGDILLSVVFVGIYVRNLRRSRGLAMRITAPAARTATAETSVEEVTMLRAELAMARHQLSACRADLADCTDAEARAAA